MGQTPPATTETKIRAPTGLLWEPWAKADRKQDGDGPEWHPLLCHLLDVAACAQRLLRDTQADRLARLCALLGLSEVEGLSWLVFFAGLHDLGKATPVFQRKIPEHEKRLQVAGLDFPVRDVPHGALSVPLATGALAGRAVPEALARSVARAIGAHHGEFASLASLQNLLGTPRALLGAYGGKSPLWNKLRSELVDALAKCCGVVNWPAAPFAWGPQGRNAFIVELAGLTTTADWLGSNEAVFHYVQPPATPERYWALAQDRAAEMMQTTGWRRPPRPLRRRFHDLFSKDPWPLHTAIEDVLAQLDGPALILVEAPMGEGKTEAAFTVFDTRGDNGLYFALPTQATSNQILGRVERFLKDAFPEQTHELHLVHGDAALSDRYGALQERARRLKSIHDDGGGGQDQGPVADAWFTRRKRALLAPLGVGTIDQALLGVLGVRHGFLRLYGLAGKTVVIDEVHAYDTYSSKLIDRFLQWLRPLGATVVLLSATLPAARRRELLAAWGAAPVEEVPYPRITVAQERKAVARPFKSRRTPLPVTLSWLGHEAAFSRLTQVLSQGGCAAWITNTVASSQRVFSCLKSLKAKGSLPPDAEIGLLHARLPFAVRAEREIAAERSFGPPREGQARPRCAILVGTQVLEQSLDLDFDLMITELAPVDLVLQRAGRLHRHARAWRPAPLQAPQLWLLEPDGASRPQGPAFGAAICVYDERLLLETWRALRDRKEIVVPADIETLIESVYAGQVPAEIPDKIKVRLDRLEQASEGKRLAQRQQAALCALAGPDEENPFHAISVVYDDENPEIHQALRAATRLGDVSVRVIPLVRLGSKTFLARRREVETHLDDCDRPPPEEVKALAREALPVSDKRLVAELLRECTPPLFKATGHLRYHRPLILDETGCATLGGVAVRLDADLGLVIGSLEEPPTSPPSLECPDD